MQLPRTRLLPILLLLILIFLQYRLWFKPNDIPDMIRVRNELGQQNKENDKLKMRNELLVNQVKHLHKDKDAVESRARDELGMIKRGETFYQVINK